MQRQPAQRNESQLARADQQEPGPRRFHDHEPHAVQREIDEKSPLIFETTDFRSLRFCRGRGEGLWTFLALSFDPPGVWAPHWCLQPQPRGARDNIVGAHMN